MPLSSAPTDAPLVAERIWASVRRSTILRDVSLFLPHGTITGILGANGAGKTTFLRVVSGVLRPSEGAVSLDGRPIESYSRSALARRLGVIPQYTDFTLELSVRDIVSMGRFCHRPIYARPERDDESITLDALRAMRLDDLSDRAAHTLSGGERQRMFIAQVLAQRAHVVLLDEPTAHLDVRYQIDILQTFQDMVRLNAWTAATVLHDLRLAYRFCDRLAFLRKGELLAVGPTRAMADEGLVRETFGVEARFGESDPRLDVQIAL